MNLTKRLRNMNIYAKLIRGLLTKLRTKNLEREKITIFLECFPN